LRSGQGLDRREARTRTDQRALPVYPSRCRSGGTNLDAAIKANAKIQAALLRQSSPVFAEHIKQNQLKIVAGFYDLATGTVSVLD
jgi:carbonic anhydrase